MPGLPGLLSQLSIETRMPWSSSDAHSTQGINAKDPELLSTLFFSIFGLTTYASGGRYIVTHFCPLDKAGDGTQASAQSCTPVLY